MTIQNTVAEQGHTGNGIATNFAYSFKLYDEDHLKVTVDGVATTGYSVTGIGNDAGGTLIFDTPPANGAAIRIYRDTPRTQITDYQAYGRFPAETHERRLDQLTAMIQEIWNDALFSSGWNGRELRRNLNFTGFDANNVGSIDAEMGVFDSLSTASEGNIIEYVNSQDSSVLASAKSYVDASLAAYSAYANYFVAPEAYGAVGDGVADDTSAWENLLASGYPFIYCDPNATYLVSKRLVASSSVVILSSGASIVGDSSVFNREDGQYDMEDGVILKVNAPVFEMKGIRIALDSNANGSNTTTGLLLSDCKFDVCGCELDTFSKSKVVRIQSGKKGSKFNGNYVHDCLIDSLTTGQLTAIDVDDNRGPSGLPSTGVEIAHNTIENMLASAAFEASFFYQTDGINISFPDSNNIWVHHNRINNVGECVDCFGKYNHIHHNFMENAFVAGVKLINGASYNQVHHNIVLNPRTYGVTCAGAPQAGRDVVGNRVYNNTIIGVNSSSDSALTSFALGLEGLTVSVPRDNTYSNNTVVECGNASRLVFSEVTNPSNAVLETKIVGSVPAVKVLNASGGRVTFEGKSQAKAYPSAQSIPSGGATIDLANVVFDSLGEISGNTFTASKPAVVDLDFGMRTGAANSGSDYTIRVLKNGADVIRDTKHADTSGDFYMRISGTGIRLNEGDSVTVFLSHTEAGSISLTSSETYSLSINER